MVSGPPGFGLARRLGPFVPPTDACVISLNSCGFCSLIDWICRQDYRLNHILGVQEHHAANLPRIIWLGWPSSWTIPSVRDLWQRLMLAMNKIIHDDDIPVGCSQDAIARRNSDEKNASCVKPDSQEREASAIARSGQYVLAKQQVTVNIEVFDFRAVD